MSPASLGGPGRTGVAPVLAVTIITTAALVVVPRRWQISDASAGIGFDPSVAHLLLLLGCIACIALYAIGNGARDTQQPQAILPAAGSQDRAFLALAAVVCAVLTTAVYFPPFLARYGTYGEDKYFMSVLQRALVGQRPYIDFEFIYGPLLIHPVVEWMRTFGYSLKSYYSLLILLEATTFATLAVALGMAIADRRRWLAAIAVAGLLLFNDNLGLSWIALRRLMPILVLLAYAMRAEARHGWLWFAGLLGVQCVLSLEYALACAIAIVGAAIVESVSQRRAGPFLRACRGVAVGTALGGVVALLMMGRDAMGWLVATWEVIALRGGGEAGFAFAPSVNALAVFFLLMLASARMGAGLRAILTGASRDTSFLAGDRFLLASLAYAAIAAKSGMARSDMYHLVPPVLGLVGVVLLSLPHQVFGEAPRFRRASVLAVAMICLTYLPGLVGAGRIWAEGLVRGARDVAAGRPASGPDGLTTRAPRLGSERSDVVPEWTELAEFLADPIRSSRPVVYYGAAWGLDRWIGVAKPIGVYPTDDYLVSDEVGRSIRTYLEANETALVVIASDDWESLIGTSPAPTYTSMFWLFGERSGLVRFLEFWSSSHYGEAVVDEQTRKADRWRRTVGEYLAVDYRVVGSHGGSLVLERRS